MERHQTTARTAQCIVLHDKNVLSKQ